jgi:hypothetical protein
VTVKGAECGFNQSLEISERIGYVEGKAATLHELGILYAKKGEVD